MIISNLSRYPHNPILHANPDVNWEAIAAFNPNVIKNEGIYHMLYRVISKPKDHEGTNLSLSTIAYAQSRNGKDFGKHHQLIAPEHEWEKYGCEDPRITYIDGMYYIFYTALSTHPPDANSIKIALAVSYDLKTVKEKHLITPFNAKAMALFPKKINGKFCAILTAHTDLPPSKIALAYFDKIEDFWSPYYWQKWYHQLNKHTMMVARLNTDQVEVGAVPVETNEGWLLIYSHIQNYYDHTKRIFGIEALLLDLESPEKIIGRTSSPLLKPKEEYELKGQVNNVIFPSGAIIEKKDIYVYYGAADTSCALATGSANGLVYNLLSSPVKKVFKLKKYAQNPILQPVSEQTWQSQAVFNAAAVYTNKQFYLIYRALSHDNTSTLGCAVSKNGHHFHPCSNEPIYVPRMTFEQKKKPNALSGCEDPRITRIKDKYYMLYTAYDGVRSPRVALSWITVDNFNKRQWIWSEPVLISPDNIDDKNACLFPEKINGQYVIFHRVEGQEIAIDFTKNLDFGKDNLLKKEGAIYVRPKMWDSQKIGIAAPPFKTNKGWLLIYHGVSSADHQYRLGYMLLDLNNPLKILFRSQYPILEPTESFEKHGLVNNVVFSCGSVVVDGKLFVYYGGGDRVICLATAKFDDLLRYAN